MDVEKELAELSSQLHLVRQGINNLLTSGHIQNYSTNGASAQYRTLKELRTDESHLLRSIRTLEVKKSGGDLGVITGGIRI